MAVNTPPVVLVVEDDADACQLLADRFHLEGYTVVTANNGLDAWEAMIRGLRPTAIILDIMLPKMDGVELRTRMLHDPELEQIPVFVVTAIGIAQLGLTNVVRVFRKPIVIEALVESVGEVCG